jgi:hypothetical protein
MESTYRQLGLLAEQKMLMTTSRRRGATTQIQAILNTQIYEVIFPDGSTQQYAANVIAENMLSTS